MPEPQPKRRSVPHSECEERSHQGAEPNAPRSPPLQQFRLISVVLLDFQKQALLTPPAPHIVLSQAPTFLKHCAKDVSSKLHGNLDTTLNLIRKFRISDAESKPLRPFKVLGQDLDIPHFES